jgi:hypothetical protein
MSIKLDLHVHSESRGKIFINSRQLRECLKAKRLDGVAITNFFGIAHALWLKEKVKDFIIIVGQEIWAKEGHIVGLELKKKIDDFQSAQETIRQIHEQGGLAVAVHPYLFLGVKQKAMSLGFDAIEAFNAAMGWSVLHNYLAGRLSKGDSIPRLASTDTTSARFIGHSYTEVLTEDSGLILDTIRSGRLKLFKRAIPLPLAFILKNLLQFRDIEPCAVHAVPCHVCDKSMSVRLVRRRFKCADCGKTETSNIVCCNGHYLCIDCIGIRSAENNIAFDDLS